MENTRENWDKVAGNYQDVFRLGLNDYNAALLRFWKERGMLFPGARVLDIGCGVGKYGTYLAELGYDVTLTDISAEMLRHAEQNMEKYQTPWAVYRCDFNDISGEEPVFAGGFDLAISTMSPAVHDARTVGKMSALSRRWCFLARFYDWEQPFRDLLMQDLGMAPRRIFRDLKSDCTSMIQSVCKAGFMPLVRYVDYNWADPRTPEQMAYYMLQTCFGEEERTEDLHERLLCAARNHVRKNSMVVDNVNTKVVWIYWKTEGRI